MTPWKRRDRNRQDKGDTAYYYCTTTVLLYYYCTTTVLLYYYCTAVLLLYYCTTCTTVLLYYCTTVLLLRAPAPKQLRPPKQLKMIIETDPPLLRILVVWRGVNNQETTLSAEEVPCKPYQYIPFRLLFCPKTSSCFGSGCYGDGLMSTSTHGAKRGRSLALVLVPGA